MIAKQMIDLNKAAFDNAFDTFTIFLYYMEKTFRFFYEKAHLFPPEGEKVIIDCMEACKKSRKDFKDSVDDSFNACEHFIVDLANATGFFVDTLVECREQSVTEDADKSIQTEIIRPDEVQKQDEIIKDMVVGADSETKIVRKSFKRLKKIKNKNQEEENGTETNRKTDA